MKFQATWLLAALPLALWAGCAEEDMAVEDDPMIAETETAPIAADAPATSMEMGATTITMEPLNDSGVMGEATIGESGGQTEVLVRLTSAPAGSHAGHIHQGSCDSLGSVVTPLQPIEVGPDGTGTMTATADVAAMNVMDGQHIVVYHGDGEDPGTPVVCGQIPGSQM